MASTLDQRPATSDQHLSLYRKVRRFIGRRYILPVIAPMSKSLFVRQLPSGAKLLDVGCGNNSPKNTKHLRQDIYYVGIDVADCNTDDVSKNMADEYIITSGENFADTIDHLPHEFDAVISSHNLEHCNHPMETLDAICGRLKPGGRLYLAFPSESTVTLPSRKGCLNFYDDPSHIYLPDFKVIMKRLIRTNGMSVDYVAAPYRPFISNMIGMIQDRFIKDRATYFTWCYYGFETKIWAHKK